MKTKFEEFIEASMPSVGQRGSFKAWIKNVINGVKNDKALILYGIGPCGKSMLIRLIDVILEGECLYADYGILRTEYHRNDIKDSKLIFFSGYPTTGHGGRIECLIENTPMTIRGIGKNKHYHDSWPNVLIEANALPNDSLARRSITINMGLNESSLMDAKLLAKLMDEKESIRDWFLK